MRQHDGGQQQRGCEQVRALTIPLIAQHTKHETLGEDERQQRREMGVHEGEEEAEAARQRQRNARAPGAARPAPNPGHAPPRR